LAAAVVLVLGGYIQPIAASGDVGRGTCVGRAGDQRRPGPACWGAGWYGVAVVARTSCGHADATCARTPRNAGSRLFWGRSTLRPCLAVWPRRWGVKASQEREASPSQKNRGTRARRTNKPTRHSSG
jgi:hypothetical protein